MCIRDRGINDREGVEAGDSYTRTYTFKRTSGPASANNYNVCLLYTSDAADERSSVDLGGRRIIKKQTQITPYRAIHIATETKYTNASRLATGAC